jgi:hypothetical protein
MVWGTKLHKNQIPQNKNDYGAKLKGKFYTNTIFEKKEKQRKFGMRRKIKMMMNTEVGWSLMRCAGE